MAMPTEPIYFLLVDDRPENLTALEALLKRDGLTLLMAHSGPEALELLLKYDVALALLDVRMPGMDGFELAELMRGTERTRSVPIIFITAGVDDTQRRFRGYEAGAVDFLTKPIEPTILQSKATTFFQLHRQRQEIARLLAETRQYAEALKESDRRKDEFLATLAHELRNPLAPIRNGLNILRMNPHASEAEEVRGMMDRQLTHMVRLIDDLLDISRVSQGKIELHTQPVTLQDAAQSAFEAARPFIERKQHRLIWDLPEKECWVEGDPTRMAQIIGNLLNNAAKYTPEGGEIRLGLRKENGQGVLSVADNGIGLETAMLTRIFDLFAQVENGMPYADGGLGIGLALVRHLVELHGGGIEAHSEGLGKGSVFIVRMPLIAAPESAGIAEAAAADADRPLQVLVVDDNEASAKTIGWMLEMIGHEYRLAHSGGEAMEMAKKTKPDVILLDIGLPDMNGYDVCRELQKDSALKNTTFIAQTGWGQKRDRDMALEAGFHHHMIKPIDLEALKKLLSEVACEAVVS